MKVPKKTLLWICIVIGFVSLFSMRAQIGRSIGAEAHKPMSHLTFTQVGVGSPEFGLSPLTADVEYNDRLMSLVVGSLLRMDRSGNLVPYLAKDYSVSNDGKAWSFTLRDGLFAEDGSPITAKGYVESFNRLARLYLKVMGGIPYFDALAGFSEFKNGKESISGLVARENSVIFNFAHAPENFLIIYATPAFGYYTAKDFVNGDWADPKKITSTGPMKVEEINTTSVKLVVRKDWPMNSSNHLETIELRLSSKNPEPNSPFSVVRIANEAQSNLQGFRTVPGIPQWLVTLILNPVSAHLSPEIRDALTHVWWAWHRDHILKLESSKSSPAFNYLDQYNFEPKPLVRWPKKVNQKLTVGIRSALNPEETEFIKGLFAEIESKLGLKLILEPVTNPSFEDLYADKLTNGRITHVVVGANGHNSNNQLMFATKLGVCLPDPSGRIQKLVAEYADQGKSIDQSYLNNFAKFLFEDGAVLPLFHRSNLYLVSKDIPSTNIPSDIDNTPLDRFSP